MLILTKIEKKAKDINTNNFNLLKDHLTEIKSTVEKSFPTLKGLFEAAYEKFSDLDKFCSYMNIYLYLKYDPLELVRVEEVLLGMAFGNDTLKYISTNTNMDNKDEPIFNSENIKNGGG